MNSKYHNFIYTKLPSVLYYNSYFGQKGKSQGIGGSEEEHDFNVNQNKCVLSHNSFEKKEIIFKNDRAMLHVISKSNNRVIIVPISIVYLYGIPMLYYVVTV